jgi:hypothetical protein
LTAQDRILAIALRDSLNYATNDEVVAVINDVLEVAAKRVEDMDLYDGWDESTRNAAATLIRELKLELINRKA